MDIFCCGIMLLVWIIAFLMINAVLKPNSRLLFGIGNLHKVQPVRVPPTKAMGLISGLILLCLVLVLWYSFQFFQIAPLTVFSTGLLFVIVMILVFRYLQLAIQLDQNGRTEILKRVNILLKNKPNPEMAANTLPYLTYTFADGIQGEISIDPKLVWAYKHRKLNAEVTCLENQPAIHRIKLELLDNEDYDEDWEENTSIRSSQRSGPANEIISSVLVDLAGLGSGSFATMSHQETGRFVQFLMVADVMILELPLNSLTEAENLRAGEFFGRFGIDLKQAGHNTLAYQMDFPPMFDRIEKAVSISQEIFSVVFGLPENVPLHVEFHDTDRATAKPGRRKAEKRRFFQRLFLILGLICVAISIYFFGQYVYLLKNQVSVQGVVVDTRQAECPIVSETATSYDPCYAAVVEFTASDGVKYVVLSDFRFFAPYIVGDELIMVHQPGHPEKARLNYSYEYNLIILPAAYGIGSLVVGFVLMAINRRRAKKKKSPKE